MDTYFIVLSVQTGAAYSHLYYITYPSLSLVKCGTLYKGMMLSHAIISKLGGNREEQGFCPSPFISRYFRALCFWKSAFLLGRHNSAIGIFMA